MSSAVNAQQNYYNARAAEYDQWFFREGRYDRGRQANAEWFADIEELKKALSAWDSQGDCLELACGTGLWTGQLTERAKSLAVVDGSAEMLDLCRARLPDQPIHYIHGDLFDWQPPRQYDSIFFAFWLSHVPPDQFDPFWAMVRTALRPGGRVFFIDSRRVESSTATDHQLPPADHQTLTRKLNDGREFEIYKVFYDPADLEERLRECAFKVSVRQTSRYFLFGEGGPVPEES